MSLFMFRVQQWQDAHKKAWDAVGSYMSSNFQFFEGRAIEAESTVLPALSTWMTETLGEIADSFPQPVDFHCFSKRFKMCFSMVLAETLLKEGSLHY